MRCTYIQQHKAIVITTQIEMKTMTRIATTRMNSTRVRLRKNPSVGSSSVAPGLLSRSEDEDPVVTSLGPCELLEDGLLLDIVGPRVTVSLLGASGSVGTLMAGATTVHESPMFGKLCSAAVISCSVAFSAKQEQFSQ